MRVIIRAAAENDLDRIFAWIAKDNPVVVLSIVHGAQHREKG